MPFQAIPIAMRKNTGTPLSKLLLIYLTSICEIPEVEYIGVSANAANGSKCINLDFGEAARFCQATESEVLAALLLLERLGLAAPDGQWLFRNEKIKTEEDRWEFMWVRLPLSERGADSRKRIKASDDQLAGLTEAARYRCAGCGRHEDVFDYRWAVDHIIPRSVGGADVEENCQAICADCNSRKGAKVHWVDFMGGRR